jgi:hypothetical protein
MHRAAVKVSALIKRMRPLLDLASILRGSAVACTYLGTHSLSQARESYLASVAGTVLCKGKPLSKDA